MLSKQDKARFRDLSIRLDIPEAEVHRAVQSFFDSIALTVGKLPFKADNKIYMKDAFDDYGCVWNIPYIGRIGTSYSRYLAWRRNDAKETIQEPRSRYRARRTQDDIEHMAESILSGGSPFSVIKRKGSEMYNRVWVVGRDGKRSAWQVIPKQKQDVQD